jgi:uncharacterized protein YjeT (DUF2065 family)
MDDLWTAVAMVLVIEGSLYALFPGPMRRMIEEALAMPEAAMRFGGVAAAATGVAIVWLLRA